MGLGYILDHQVGRSLSLNMFKHVQTCSIFEHVQTCSNIKYKRRQEAYEEHGLKIARDPRFLQKE